MPAPANQNVVTVAGNDIREIVTKFRVEETGVLFNWDEYPTIEAFVTRDREIPGEPLIYFRNEDILRGNNASLTFVKAKDAYVSEVGVHNFTVVVYQPNFPTGVGERSIVHGKWTLLKNNAPEDIQLDG